MALRATHVCDFVRLGIVMRRSILYRPFVLWATRMLQVFQELIDPIGGSLVVVRTAGLEPAQGFPQGILRLLGSVEIAKVLVRLLHSCRDQAATTTDCNFFIASRSLS
jgi:hypothetical protein